MYSREQGIRVKVEVPGRLNLPAESVSQKTLTDNYSIDAMKNSRVLWGGVMGDKKLARKQKNLNRDSQQPIKIFSYNGDLLLEDRTWMTEQEKLV